MPSPLISIKEYILNHSDDEVQKQIPQWLQQLKQQHISSMALQALLCHFSQTKETPSTTDNTTGFINPEDIQSVDEKELIDLRNQVSTLRHKLGLSKEEVKKLNGRCKKLVIGIVVVILLGITFYMFSN